MRHHLEIERVVGDEGEEAVACVNGDASEHAAGTDPRHDPAQLVDDERAEGGADGHASSTIFVTVDQLRLVAETASSFSTKPFGKP